MTPSQRLETARVLTQAVLRLERAGIALREPELDDHGIVRRLAEMRFGKELARRLYDRTHDEI